MPLIVPILRLAMLFLNVYESFKTLKAPTPSARSGGQPSVRAMSQRKRDMKGCLAVWVVWVRDQVDENDAQMLNLFIGIFIPFYGELKSLVLIFLILTRARGAEPIYLHVIRPLIKPHTATLDSLLDLICIIGDFLFLLSTFPLRLALSSWRSLSSYNEEGLDSESDLRDPSAGGKAREHETLFSEDNSVSQSTAHQGLTFPRPHYNTQRASVLVKTDKPSLRETVPLMRATVRTRRQAFGEGLNEQIATGTTDPSKRGQINPPPGQSQHQVWYPPPSSYDDTDGVPTDQTSLPPSSSGACGPKNALQDASLETEGAARESEQVDEWRIYPQFPSAYPPTPLATSSRLPSNPDVVSPTPRRPSDSIRFPTIPEDPQRQDFGRSLLPPREPLNPGFLGGASDEDNGILGVQNNGSLEMVIDGDESETDDDDADDDDGFDITLRTPRPPLGASGRFHTRSNEEATIASSSGSSLPSPSTALTTIDNGSSFRTRTTSESSSLSMSISDSSSLLGRKRSLPQHRPTNVKSKARTPDGLLLEKPSRVRTVMRPRPRRNMSSGRIDMSQKQTSKRASSSESVDDSLEGSAGYCDSDEDGVSDPKPPEVKRRRVVVQSTRKTAVYSTRTPRPGARRTKGVSIPLSPAQQDKSVEVPPIVPRTSSRLRNGPAAPRRPGVVPSIELSQPGSSSANNSVPPRRTSERNAPRRK